MTTATLSELPVIIVAFGNPGDVRLCLEALGRSAPSPWPAVFICENAGDAAFDRLVATLCEAGGPCRSDPSPPLVSSPRLVRTQTLRLATGDPSRTIRVHVGEAVENLGYAGGVNVWLEPLLSIPGWAGAWILNPDTEPEPDALEALVDYAERHGRGMVGGRLCSRANPDVVHSRGLAWRKWRANPRAVDWRTPAADWPPAREVDPRLDSPSGASMYVTRDCIEHIGLMDERYFLLFEDLDWGLKAKQRSLIGYAHQSVVVHEGGTTIGTAALRKDRSPLSVYLDFRNRVLFVRQRFPGWVPWTVFISLLEIAEYGRLRARRNVMAALRGLTAGVKGHTGRPDHMLDAHLASAAQSTPAAVTS